VIVLSEIMDATEIILMKTTFLATMFLSTNAMDSKKQMKIENPTNLKSTVFF